MRARGLLLVFPVAWLACFSSKSNGIDIPQPKFDASFEASGFPEAATPEASVEASVDATAEAAPEDASVEAEAAGPQPITVVVGGATGFESGVNIVFSDASGAVVTTTTTDVTGTAATLLTTVTTATAVLGTTANPSLYTFMGLKPGDTVLVPDQTSLGSLPPTTLTALPAATFEAEAPTSYTVQAGQCSNSGQAPPIEFSLNPSFSGPPCVGLAQTGGSFGAAFPALVEAYDGTGDLLGYAYSKSNLLSATDDTGQVDVAIGGSWSTETTTQTLQVANVPDGGASPSVAYSEVADGVLTPLGTTGLPADAGTDAYAVTTHPGFADSVVAEEMFLQYTTGAQANVEVSSAPAPTTDGTVTIDVSAAAAAPTFTGVSLVSPEGGQAITAQPTVGWSLASGDFSGATGVVAIINWSYQDNPPSGTWTIVTPGTAATSVTAPAFPSQLAAYLPQAGANGYVNNVVAVYGQTAMPTYASMLPAAVLFNPQICGFYQPVAPPIPGVGTALFVAYAPGSQC